MYSLYIPLSPSHSLSLCIWLNNFHGQLPPVGHKLPQITAKRQTNPYNEIKIHSQNREGREGGTRQSQNEHQEKQQQQH